MTSTATGQFLVQLGLLLSAALLLRRYVLRRAVVSELPGWLRAREARREQTCAIALLVSLEMTAIGVVLVLAG